MTIFQKLVRSRAVLYHSISWNCCCLCCSPQTKDLQIGFKIWDSTVLTEVQISPIWTGFCQSALFCIISISSIRTWKLILMAKGMEDCVQPLVEWSDVSNYRNPGMSTLAYTLTAIELKVGLDIGDWLVGVTSRLQWFQVDIWGYEPDVNENRTWLSKHISASFVWLRSGSQEVWLCLCLW